MLCDSNILIYPADPDDVHCLPFVERDDAAIASLSRIEVLGFHGLALLSQDHRDRLQEIVTSLIELELPESVIKQAISLRQKSKMSLADAVIAATALANRLPLATRNVQDFKHVIGLEVVNPFAGE